MTVPRYSYLIERDQDIWLIYFMDDGDLVRGEYYLDYEGALVAGELWLQEMNKEAPGIGEPGSEGEMRAFFDQLDNSDDEWDKFFEELKAEDKKRGIVAKS